MDGHQKVHCCRPCGSTNNDAALLSLEKKLVAIAGELNHNVNRCEQLLDEARTKDDENALSRLAPIERAIMETPAYTIAGLGVKARHAAHVLSEYWEVPIDQIDWEARTVRLLIEAICEVAGRLGAPDQMPANNRVVFTEATDRE
jgi:hypothetical protein